MRPRAPRRRAPWAILGRLAKPVRARAAGSPGAAHPTCFNCGFNCGGDSWGYSGPLGERKRLGFPRFDVAGEV